MVLHPLIQDKLKSPVKIGIQRAAVAFFVQAVNLQEYFRIQLISISHWSLKSTQNFCGVKPLFCYSFWERAVNRVSARRRVQKI